MTALLALALLAADPPAKPDAKPAGPPEFEVQFANGSTLKQVVVLTKALEVSTKYGALSIPVGDLRRVEVGKGEKAADTVEAVEYTARGKLETAELKVRTVEFGETTLKLANLKGLRSSAGQRSAEVTLDAGKYARPNWAEWLETDVEVAAGDAFEITAMGSVEHLNQGTGPSGMAMAAPTPPPGAEARHLSEFRGRTPWGAGLVVGRVGKDGRPFPVGASYRGKSTTAGRVYLIIAPNPFAGETTGSYKVTVKAGG